MAEVAQTPEPPYYAVIFTSRRTEGDHGSAEMAKKMEELGASSPGFLGIESCRGADGLGITVSYWANLEAIRAWRNDFEHQEAQRGGREKWYERYHVRVAKVERAYGGP